MQLLLIHCINNRYFNMCFFFCLTVCNKKRVNAFFEDTLTRTINHWQPLGVPIFILLAHWKKYCCKNQRSKLYFKVNQQLLGTSTNQVYCLTINEHNIRSSIFLVEQINECRINLVSINQVWKNKLRSLLTVKKCLLSERGSHIWQPCF